ncbi:sigma-70 family RNA polymerase sigma factor [Nonomuraea sediminis]|uniref:sigma-70 family RNA polymerase sigma factor n=1 Tax=Nonomuraea sediminis TaxID=2835864 RepID=UPI0027DFB4A7|nr:sigma-70 family RNA polymerase sigma factor [Nonomuraea sediminis]
MERVPGGEDGLVAQARGGDEGAFAELVERHRGELRVHCYRMLGSFEEAEDLVQETLLRAWKGLPAFEGRSSLRSWLYRIATNACLDALEARERRVLPYELGPPETDGPRMDIPWLQPYPTGNDPATAAVSRETIELAFLAAIQHLPPRQRAVLILRDVLGWPSRQTAALLDGTQASVNSALQRARATLRQRLPGHRLDWAARSHPTDEERAVLRRYMDAVERADLAAMADLLAEEVRATMPPYPTWFLGRQAVLGSLRASWDPAHPIGRFTMLPLEANRQPAAAAYLDGRAFAIAVLGVEGGRITELTAFHDVRVFEAFGLPMTFPPDARLEGGRPRR